MHRIEDAGLPSIQAIVGSSLGIVGREPWTSIFGFAVRPSRPESNGHKASQQAWSLHVECGWRFIDGGTVVTGSEDHFDIPDESNPQKSSITRLEHQLADWLPNWSWETPEVKEPDRFVVISVATSKYNDIDIVFSNGIRLQVFPDGVGKSWSFFANEEPTRRLVISGGRISPRV